MGRVDASTLPITPLLLARGVAGLVGVLVARLVRVRVRADVRAGESRGVVGFEG